jgi:hypothetical protein
MPIAPAKSPPQHALHADSTRGTLRTHIAVVRAARHHHPSARFYSCLGVRRSAEATRIWGDTGVRPGGCRSGSESPVAPHSPQPGSPAASDDGPASDEPASSSSPRICKHLAALLMWAVYGCTPPSRAPKCRRQLWGCIVLYCWKNRSGLRCRAPAAHRPQKHRSAHFPGPPTG